MESYEVVRALLDITEYESKALVVLFLYNEGLSKSDLAEKAKIPRSKIYGVVDSLMDWGYLGEAEDGKLVIDEPIFATTLKSSLSEITEVVNDLNSLRTRHLEEMIAQRKHEVKELEALKEGMKNG